MNSASAHCIIVFEIQLLMLVYFKTLGSVFLTVKFNFGYLLQCSAIGIFSLGFNFGPDIMQVKTAYVIQDTVTSE